MGNLMMENGKMDKNMGLEPGLDWWEIVIVDNGNMINLMVKEFINGLMENNIRDNLMKVWNMVLVKKYSQMEIDMWGCIKMANQKEMENIFIQVEHIFMVNFWMD